MILSMAHICLKCGRASIRRRASNRINTVYINPHIRLLVEPRSVCETIIGRYLVDIHPEVRWYLNLTSTRTTAIVTTLSVFPNYLKCNISMNNCPIALKFCTEVQSQYEYISGANTAHLVKSG